MFLQFGDGLAQLLHTLKAQPALPEWRVLANGRTRPRDLAVHNEEEEAPVTEQKHIIDPERLGLWTAVSFTVALLALVVALTGLFRVSDLGYVTQVEALLLHKQMTETKTCAPSAADAPSPSNAPAIAAP